MALKTLVKVGNISNLSDARYCSGMGVDMLGFSVIEGQPAYISAALYQELRGWISGPVVVAELYGIKDSNLLSSIRADYRPDYLEISASELRHIPSSETTPLIISINSKEDIGAVLPYREKVAYLQVNEVDKNMVNDLPTDFAILLALHSNMDVDSVLNEYPLKGIALSGSPELRPGYKDYGDLADVLEKLEC